MQSNENLKNNRIFYLDLLRVIALFAMMMLHVSTSYWYAEPVDEFNWQVFNFYDCLVRFCVPVFVMISGVFFLDLNRKVTYEKILKHNIFRLVTAFIFWSFVYGLVLNNVISNIMKKKPIDFIKMRSALINGHYHMWFLFVIIGLYLITPFLRQIVLSKELEKIFIILSFLLCFIYNAINLFPGASFICEYIDKFYICLFSGYAGYFMLGHYLHNYEITKKAKYIIYIFAVISIIFTIITSRYLSISTGIPNEDLFENLLPNILFISMAIFIYFKGLHFPEHYNTVMQIIEKISFLSFGMYLIHDFFIEQLKKVGLATVAFNPIISVPVISVCVFCCSAVSIFVISKIPVLKKYII